MYEVAILLEGKYDRMRQKSRRHKIRKRPLNRSNSTNVRILKRRLERARAIRASVEKWFIKNVPDYDSSPPHQQQRIDAAKTVLEAGLLKLVLELGGKRTTRYLEHWVMEIPYLDGGMG